MKKNLTYISLFSSAGIGCYAFKKENFDCVATCEINQRRLNIQKINKKCRFSSGYICGDLTLKENHKKILNEVKRWRRQNQIDVVIATPPCQGMSVANQKKKDETKRNSLVTEAIKIINEIKPKIFIFENVRSFLKTICSGLDNVQRPIYQEIINQLGSEYVISSRILNFKNYGSNSSRHRTLVIGVKREISNFVAPYDLFPDFTEEISLKQCIGKFKSLKTMGEHDPENPLHNFKKYSPSMRDWIKNLKPGQSAMDNTKENEIPCKIVDGKKLNLKLFLEINTNAKFEKKLLHVSILQTIV